jgi:WD40 repeat protein
VQVWDIDTVKPLQGRVLFHGLPDRPNQKVCLSPDGTTVAVSGFVARLGDQPELSPIPASLLAFHPRGDAMFLAKPTGLVELADLSGQRLTSPFGEVLVKELVISVDGRHALLLSQEGVVRLWDLERNSQIAYPFDPDLRVLHARFRPDGRQILTAGTKAGQWEIQLRPYPVVRRGFEGQAAILWAEIATLRRLVHGADNSSGMVSLQEADLKDRLNRFLALVGLSPS